MARSKKEEEDARFVFKSTPSSNGVNVTLTVDGVQMAKKSGFGMDLKGLVFEIYCKKRFSSKADDVPSATIKGFDGVNEFYKKQTGKKLEVSFTKSSKEGASRRYSIIGMDEA